MTKNDRMASGLMSFGASTGLLGAIILSSPLNVFFGIGGFILFVFGFALWLDPPVPWQQQKKIMKQRQGRDYWKGYNDGVDEAIRELTDE